MIADSIKSFLEDHVKKLKQDWYMTLRGSIETYALTPSDEGAYGSVAVTNGVKVTAVAYYNHIISQFHSFENEDHEDVYMFSYQIKIIDDPEYQDPFHSC